MSVDLEVVASSSVVMWETLYYVEGYEKQLKYLWRMKKCFFLFLFNPIYMYVIEE